jgi:hypothetical protein
MTHRRREQLDELRVAELAAHEHDSVVEVDELARDRRLSEIVDGQADDLCVAALKRQHVQVAGFVAQQEARRVLRNFKERTHDER